MDEREAVSRTSDFLEELLLPHIGAPLFTSHEVVELRVSSSGYEAGWFLYFRFEANESLGLETTSLATIRMWWESQERSGRTFVYGGRRWSLLRIESGDTWVGMSRPAGPAAPARSHEGSPKHQAGKVCWEHGINCPLCEGLEEMGQPVDAVAFEP
jgi:hypothetical protein